MVGSTIGLTTALILCKVFIKNPIKKDIVLKIAAILTLILHYSPLYVDFFKTGSAEIIDTMLLPVYPCNVAMWFLVIVAFCKNKQGKFFKTVAVITFYLGVIGGILGIAFNEIYSHTPTLADWDVLHGLLSHVTLLFGCIFVLVGGYIKIRVSNLIPIFIGEVLLIVDGYLIIGLFTLCGIEPVNCMFLLEPPLANLPWLNVYVIGVFALILFFAITALVEQFAVKKGERWYNKIKLRRKK